MQATENLHETAMGLDTLPIDEIAARLHAAQADAIAAVAPAIPKLVEAARLMADTVRNGGQLIYAAAGSSGLMAMADALELPGTFGLSPSNMHLLMAGGLPGKMALPGDVEDDVADARKAAETIRAGDIVIAVSASGSTPFALEIVREAREKHASVIGIANNAEVPLFDYADVAICLPTPPELVAGSTRMGAGTAQKIALNIMSTLMGVLLGHVHDGMMVNLIADNDKLRKRAERIVSSIAHVSESTAREHLETAGGAVKQAVLLARGAASTAQADQLLASADGHLRPALAELEVSLSETKANQT
ncbi:MAG: N-acetylmuramic acid 6-phosphate etherase [Geminicoccales bacterium]